MFVHDARTTPTLRDLDRDHFRVRLRYLDMTEYYL